MPAKLTQKSRLVTDLGAEDYPECVVAIFYDRAGRPTAVYTEYDWNHSRKPWFRPGKDAPTGWGSADYWFNFSRADGVLYWHQAGFGGGRRGNIGVGRPVEPEPPTLLFMAARLRATIYESEVRPRVLLTDDQLLALGYRRISEPAELARRDGRPVYDPFAVAEEGETEYCSICQDHLWSEGDDEALCDHVHWDPETGEWAGPGHAE